MNRRALDRNRLLTALEATVADAEVFFASVPESLCDGKQSAREVLAHLVFWHFEYMHVAQAIADHRRPVLRHGTFNALNLLAARQLRDEPMPVLAHRLMYRQKKLAKQLERIADWSLDFPVKEGVEYRGVAVRIAEIEAHMRAHVARLRRESRRQGLHIDTTSSTVDLFAPPVTGRHLLRFGSLA